jgi:hypothetical protein
MTETRLECDRCGRSIESGRAAVTIEAGTNPTSWPISLALGRPIIDLCFASLDTLAGWLCQPETPGPRRSPD